MKIFVVSPFYRNIPSSSRPCFVNEVLIGNGISTKIITSDYDHTTKEKIKDESNKNIHFISTLKYKKNTSVFRFISHLLLSISMVVYLVRNRRNFDGLYITAPFALVALITSFLIKKPIIIDIVDLWPDSLPFSGKLKSNTIFPFVFRVWKFLNLIAFKRASRVISSSAVFLSDSGFSADGVLIPLGGDPFDGLEYISESNKLRVLYLGNVGELYDFSTLIQSLIRLNRAVSIDIIGGGDKVSWLKEELISNRIEYRYHGVNFNKEFITSVANKCDFGFNGFRNTNASLSYKSISYLSLGLPVINSMKGDIWNMIESNGIGLNYSEESIDSLVYALNKADHFKNQESRDRVLSYFNGNLESKIISKKVFSLIKEVFND